MDARVQEAPFDFSAEVVAFQADVQNAGAVVTFTGVVRDDSGCLDHMFIEHYPAMTEAALQKFALQAMEKFGLEDPVHCGSLTGLTAAFNIASPVSYLQCYKGRRPKTWYHTTGIHFPSNESCGTKSLWYQVNA